MNRNNSNYATLETIYRKYVIIAENVRNNYRNKCFSSESQCNNSRLVRISPTSSEDRGNIFSRNRGKFPGNYREKK